MSENREDDAQKGGARIEDLPASDSELAGEEREESSSLRSPGDDEPFEPDEPDEGLRGSPPPIDPQG